jgi:hypothetical protein
MTIFSFVSVTSHSPLDHKLRGFAPEKNHQIYEAYRLQMDCYTLLLKMNGYKVNDKGIPLRF